MNVLLGNNARLSSLWKWLAEKLRSGEPEPPGHIHRFREADARSAHQRIFLFRPFDVKRRFKKRHPVVPMRDAISSDDLAAPSFTVGPERTRRTFFPFR